MVRNIVDEGLALKVKLFDDSDIDDLFSQAAEVVIQHDRASASLIQRRLSIGYARAARIIDQLEGAGVLGPADGSSPREVLIKSPDEVATIKTNKKKEKEIPEPKYGYEPPKASVIKKPKKNPWRKSLNDALKEVEKSDKYTFPLGYTVDKLISRNLKNFSHLTISGNIISDKEFLLDTILTYLIAKNSHEELKLVLVDGTSYLSFYENLQHLLAPVISSPDKVISALRWAMGEMDRRYKLFVQAKARDLESYNDVVKDNKLEHILFVINHLEDFMFYSPVEVEDAVTRLTSLGHKTGIHFIGTTNRYTKNEMSDIIQSNIPNRMFFRLTSKSDSGRVKIKDLEKLNIGEAIFISELENEPIKLDAIYTSEENVKEVVEKVLSSK